MHKLSRRLNHFIAHIRMSQGFTEGLVLRIHKLMKCLPRYHQQVPLKIFIREGHTKQNCECLLLPSFWCEDTIFMIRSIPGPNGTDIHHVNVPRPNRTL